MTKVYLRPPEKLSKAVHRIADALARHAPGSVEIVTDRAAADLVIHHVVGVQNFAPTALPELIEQDGKPFALVQLCLRTTEWPSTFSWIPLWRRAEVVWSYYDLLGEMRKDGIRVDCPFYHAPLGVDGDVFKPAELPKRFLVGTSGYVAETEGVRECARAAAELGGLQFHLGPDLHLGTHVRAKHGLSDAEVASFWSRCRYVAALRRTEGFELPGIEALACGSRPIAFDTQGYRQWFGDHAEYVPEADEGTVTAAIREILAREPRPVTDDERTAVLRRFDWASIVGGFWERLGAAARRVA